MTLPPCRFPRPPARSSCPPPPPACLPSLPQNCTDHAVMMFTHPDRKHKPMHPRAGRAYRGGGSSPWAATPATRGFQVGGNAFFPRSSSSYGGQGGKGGSGNSSGVGAGGPAGGSGAEGDVTLVEPGKVKRVAYMYHRRFCVLVLGEGEGTGDRVLAG